MMQAAAGAGGGLDIADAFSTDLYTGNGSTQTITNGIDLAGEGGLVWIKSRSNTSQHSWQDTNRGTSGFLASDSTAQEAGTSGGQVTAFNSSGFDIGNQIVVNGTGQNFVAWTFRRSPKFFDIVTYTGDGTAGRTIAHNLGIEPGMIVVKRLDSAASWHVYNRGYPSASGQMESTSAFTANALGGATDTDFTTGSFVAAWNVSGGTYVAYLFAHDTAADGVIQCGSYTGNGSTSGPTITLGWEPQYVMIKRTDDIGGWQMMDTARGIASPGKDARLFADTSDAEVVSAEVVDIVTGGFQIRTTGSFFNASGGNYIYMAIRAEGV